MIMYLEKIKENAVVCFLRKVCWNCGLYTKLNMMHTTIYYKLHVTLLFAEASYIAHR
jgi:hypothetical protein